MSQAKLDLCFLQEKKLIDGTYTRDSVGYNLVATNAPIQHRGGVAVFYHTSKRFFIEVLHQFGPNVVIFQMVMGERR